MEEEETNMIQRESRPQRRPTAALLAAGVLLAGGGLADASSSSAMTAKAAGVAAKSPAQIITAAQSALRSAHGYVMTGNMTQAKQKLKLRVTYGGSSKLEMQMSEGTGTAAIIAVPGAAYIKASKAYWQAQGGGSILRYANRWIELPASYSNKFIKQLGHFNPGTLARCLGEDHGKLSTAGTTTVSGQRSVVIRDAGGVPGSNPGTLDIAATGPAYPLRVTATGPTRKGGKVDVCNDGKGSNLEGTLNLSRFNHPPSIKAPTNAVKISSTTTTG